MEIALPVVVGAGVIAVVLLVLVVALLAGAARSRRDRAELAAARAETAALAARLDALATRVERPAGHRGEDQPSAYVITDAGSEPATGTDRAAVPDRLLLSATLGEPLVRAVSLGHGVRRALSAESRNRIRFEVRRETRRARKQRRREMKDAWRRERTTPVGSAPGTTPAEAA
ncbi:hypothetical protein GCM10027596_34010 [Nocardioides korecus]